MARLITKDTDTVGLLYTIATEVERFKKLETKSISYRDRAEKIKAEIFRALDKIPKEDFALYSEKIQRIVTRLGADHYRQGELYTNNLNHEKQKRSKTNR